MKKVFALVAAVLLLACLLWFGPWSQATPAPEVGRSAVAPVAATASTAVAPAPVVRVEVDDSLRVEVVDEQGRPVAAAVAHLGRALAPWLPEGEGRNLGITGEDGTMRVPAIELQDVEPARDALYVHHPAHLGHSVAGNDVKAALAAAQPVRVVLRRGHAQTFLFRTRAGDPVPGQTVVLGATDVVEDFTNAPPGRAGTMFEGVHRATSDASGTATVTGLPAGTHRFAVAVDPVLGVVSGAKGSEAFQVPGPPVTLTLDTLLAGGVVVRGDRIVTCTAHYYTRQLGSSYSQPLDRMTDALVAACPELKADRDLRFPLAWVGFPQDRVQPIVRWSVLLARTGWHSGETRLRPLRDGFVPEVLAIAPEHADAPMGNVLVTWPAGLPPLPFEVRLGDLAQCIVEPGQHTDLPPGKYQLKANLATDRVQRSGQPGREYLFPPIPIEVVANETSRIEARLPENVSICEVAVTFPSGAVPPKFRLQWNQGECAGSYSLPAWRSRLILLPTGFVDLTPFALGCDQSPVRVEVGPNDRVTPIRMVLRAAK